MGYAKTLFYCKKCDMDFTDGASAEGVNLLTGKPVESLEEGEDFGEGVCPNCGNKGEDIGTHDWNDEAEEE